ncbi:hypothetical protein ACWDV7_10155 [Streptomyces sp. NPDC003362]
MRSARDEGDMHLPLTGDRQPGHTQPRLEALLRECLALHASIG